MIHITHDAAEALTNARNASGATGDSGVRFFMVDTPGQGPALAFDFVTDPQPQDEVVEQDGLPVFVDQKLAGVIGESTLDVQETDGHPQLVLRSAEKH